MSPPPRCSIASTRFFLLYPNEILAFLTVAFILQAGLVPLDFQSVPVHGLASPASPLSDIVDNLVLFIPFGIFVQASWTRAFPRAFALFLTLLGALLLSCGIEWIQAYSPSRISSIQDVVCNLGGAAIGALASTAMKTIMPDLVGAALFEFRQCPSVAALKAYVVMLAVVGVMPFTIAFDVPRFKQAVGQAVIVPFGVSSAQADAALAVDLRAARLAEWTAARRWIRWAAETASFVLLAWLLQIVLRGDYRFTSRSASALTWWLSIILALGLSVGQFLIVTRGLDVTDILFRMLGVGVGLASWPWIRRSAESQSPIWIPCRALAFGVAAWIVASGLAPFRFHNPRADLLAPFSSAAFLPFMAYFQTRVDLMLTDVLEKLFSYALFAGLVAAGWSSIRRMTMGRRIIRTTAIGLTLASGIEVAQLFLPIRVVSLTDLVLAATSCLVGVMLQAHAASLLRYIMIHHILGPGTPSIALPPMNTIAQVEQIMSTLTDPSPNAPREPAPGSSKQTER